MAQNIPWKRFWSRIGESVHRGNNGLDFLTNPEGGIYEKYLNTHLLTIDNLLNEKCLILCGSPGIGKSTEIEQIKSRFTDLTGSSGSIIWLKFREIPNEGVFARMTFETEDWKCWQNSSEELALVIDEIDEGLFRIPSFISYLKRQLQTMPVHRLRLVLVCRTAEWPVSEGNELIRLWGEHEKQPIFELCPLRHCDVVQAAEVYKVDSREFIQLIYQKSVVSLAALPTTLIFLLNNFATEKSFPETHQELYEQGCKRLAREIESWRVDESRRREQRGKISSLEERLEASRQLAALLLICGKSAIYLGSDFKQEHDLLLSDGVFTPRSTQSGMTETLLLEAIHSGLFTSRGPDRVGFAHQTFAECLASQFLARLQVIQLRKLVCSWDADGEHVIPQLAETVAWVAGVNEEFFDYISKIEPEVLIRSDVSHIKPSRKKALVAAILEKAKREELFDEWGFSRFLSGLKHPELVSQLRVCMADKTTNEEARRIALEIARECKVTELFDDVMALIQDTSVQHLAARALGNITPSGRLGELVPLLDRSGKHDPDDFIRSCVLQRLVPEYWSLSQAVPHLITRQKDYHFDSFDFLLKYHLPQHVTDDDIPALLDALVVWDDCFGPLSAFSELAEITFVKALQRLSEPGIRKMAAEVWVKKAQANQLSFSSKESEVIKLLGDNTMLRREFVRAILEETDGEIDFWRCIDSQVHLILHGDLEWALNRIIEAPPERRKRWAGEIYYWGFWQAYTCWDLFLQRVTDVPELTSRYSWLHAWDLNSPEARNEKARWLKDKRLARRIHERPPAPQVNDLITDALQAIEAGKSDCWIRLCFSLSMKQGDIYWNEHLGADLTEFPGWKNADTDRRVQIRRAARSFLLINSDDYAKFRGRSNYSDPGYVAIWLLRADLQKDLPLQTAVASKWIHALLGWFNDGGEQYQDTAALAYQLDPNTTIDYFIQELLDDDKQHGDVLILEGFRKCWDKQFTQTALGLISKKHLKAGTIQTILRFVASVDSSAATVCAKNLLNTPTDMMEGQQRIVAVLTICISRLASTMWEDAWCVLNSNQTVAEATLLGVANSIFDNASKMSNSLTESQLADLYLKMREIFPPQGDPDTKRGGFVTPRRAAAHFRDQILSTLATRGTEDACRELLRLAKALPDQSVSLRWNYNNTRKNLRRNSWKPSSPKTVLELAARSEARMVAGADDLMEVVLESLKRLQTQLTRHTLPESEALWNWEGSDTRRHNFKHRDEAFLSDHIARWLERDLDSKGIILAREVQIRRGQRTDISVAAVTLQNESSTPAKVELVIEVKGCWNLEVRTALKDQLVDRYLIPNGLTHGIYLVGWFVCDKCSENNLTSKTFDEAQEELHNLAVAYDGKLNPACVCSMLLDCAYPY